jgi:hypothetical protein
VSQESREEIATSLPGAYASRQPVVLLTGEYGSLAREHAYEIRLLQVRHRLAPGAQSMAGIQAAGFGDEALTQTLMPAISGEVLTESCISRHNSFSHFEGSRLPAAKIVERIRAAVGAEISAGDFLPGQRVAATTAPLVLISLQSLYSADPSVASGQERANVTRKAPARKAGRQ